MNVSELRLGNLVYDDELLMCTIERISSKDFIHWEGAIGDYAIIGRVVGTYDDYRCVEGDKWIPIPLTEELLLKLGFEGSFDSIFTHAKIPCVYFKRPYMESNILLVKSVIGQDKITSVSSIHQLQNFFHSLTGQELEIKK